MPHSIGMITQISERRKISIDYLRLDFQSPAIGYGRLSEVCYRGPWSSRAWIAQKFVLSNNPFVCGKVMGSWILFCGILELQRLQKVPSLVLIGIDEWEKGSI